MTVSILQLVHIDETGDSYYRMRWPGRHLAEQAGWSVINLDARSVDRFTLGVEADLLVVYQSNDLDLFPVLDARREKGKRTLVEYNDNFYAPPPWSPVVKAWTAPPVWNVYAEFMRRADAVIVTGPGLRDALSARIPGQEFIEIPNFLPVTPDPLPSLLAAKTDTSSVGWGGSFGHLADILSFIPLLKGLLARHERLEIHLMGNERLPEFARTPKERLRFTKWGTMQEYFDFLRSIKVGIIPLLESGYNRCRSDIKAVEMAAFGVAPVVPDYTPYKEFLAKTGIPSYRDRASFVELVERFVLDEDIARDVAGRCYEYVIRERIGMRSTLRKEVYERFLPAARSEGSVIIPSGYHEVSGQLSQGVAVERILEQSRQLCQTKRAGDAVRLLRQEGERNRGAVDLCVAEAQILLGVSRSEALERLAHFSTSHPEEIRFELLRIIGSPDPLVRRASWQSIIGRLSKEPKSFARFYEAQIVETFLRDPSKEMEVLERLTTVYPRSARLKFELAEQLRLNGRSDEAQRAYEESIELVEIAACNQRAVQELDPPYMEMWAAALDPAPHVAGDEPPFMYAKRERWN